MRFYALIILCFTLFSAQKCSDAEKVDVDIQLTSTQSYCGGAEPPEDLLVEYKTPKPFNGQTVYLFNSDEVSVGNIDAKTDSNYQMRLKPGSYTVHLVPKLIDFSLIESEDERCYAAYKQRIISSFKIAADTSMVVNLHFGCDPCSPPPP
jgi:hypothetical protein